jgi:hypothetical protein
MKAEDRGQKTEPVRHRGHVLLTQRVPTDADVMAGVKGFHEVYYCAICKDYFVLGWQMENSPLTKTCEAVSRDCLPEPNPDLEGLRIFCPRCRRRYDQYGPVPQPGREGEEMTVRDVFLFTFCTPDHEPGLQAQPFLVSGTPYEVVILVSGELPEDPERTNLFCSFLEYELDVFKTKGLSDRACGPIAVQVLWVDKVINESAPIIAVLWQTIYRQRGLGPPLCMACGVFELKPPGDQILLCLVPVDCPHYGTDLRPGDERGPGAA